ncbi:hypothetical protein OG225_11720 [Nocardia sp. NBC_01377]|uniref:hypothetical protein n=1 Tax=Nocardia sp. NBC_01377 TaxID=2903595 RepID=UPI00324A99B4
MARATVTGYNTAFAVAAVIVGCAAVAALLLLPRASAAPVAEPEPVDAGSGRRRHRREPRSGLVIVLDWRVGTRRHVTPLSCGSRQPRITRRLEGKESLGGRVPA